MPKARGGTLTKDSNILSRAFSFNEDFVLDEVKDLHPFFTNYFPRDRADTLAFFSDEKGKLRHLALIEYKKRLKKEEKEDDDFEVVGKDLQWHKKEAEKEKIILVEVQKYEDSEGNRDGKRLGIDPNKAIIQIPKETPEEKKLILAQNIEDFLEELETGK
ncbi:31854_t:CDS:2 [Racocetra persica]|uniref:31854_t:CDS:1 n=1 Tax=Racocetra persica TaxID=160502 RepID=A0ACA9KVW0_9GLOM|nr:31854_t:CDS:2 [Racocetra persica]